MFSISVSYPQDPLSPKTWSGTTNTISQELKKRNVLGTAATSFTSNTIKKNLLHLISRIYYTGSCDDERGLFWRKHGAKHVYRSIKGDRQPVLHFGTKDLPTYPADRNIHFLYCDYTWHLFEQNCPDMTCYSRRMRRDAEILETEAYGQMAHIFSISEYVRDDLVDHYNVDPENVTVVGTGFGAIQPFHGPKDFARKQIIFVAKNRFHDKGGPLLLEGFDVAKREDPELNLTVIGDEVYRQLLGAYENVYVTGYLPLEKLQEQFENASLFAMPASNEPWGLVYLESLICKTPVLGLGKNSLPEITCDGRYGFLAEHSTPDAIAEKILEAFADPGRLARMGEEGQRHCLETYSWDRTVDRIVNRINEIVN